MDDLVLKNMSWARGFARNRARRSPDSVSLPDMEQAALVGLCQAAQRYVSTKGVPFRAYAAKRIKGAVEDQCRESSWGSRRRPVDVVVDTDHVEQHWAKMHEHLSTPIWAEELLATMLDRERRVVEMTVMDGMTLWEAGTVLGVGEAMACRLKTAGLARARKEAAA
jgi:RNA polymerase sigma factor (sigma-70 family)